MVGGQCGDCGNYHTTKDQLLHDHLRPRAHHSQRLGRRVRVVSDPPAQDSIRYRESPRSAESVTRDYSFTTERLPRTAIFGRCSTEWTPITFRLGFTPFVF